MSERLDTPPASEFTDLLADGYLGCARIPVDMMTATAALEAIRHADSRNPESFPVRRELNDQIGRAEDDRLRAVLISLRERHQAWTVAAHRQWAATATFEQWIDRLARALEDWCFDACRALLDQIPPVPPNDSAAVNALPGNIGRMLEDDWNLVADTLAWLGRHPAVNADSRARLLSRLAQVALYFDDQPASALQILDEASQLTISSRAKAEVESVRGQYQIRGTTTAASTLEKAAELDPRFVESFAYRGDVARDTGDIVAAELWYRRAIAANPGSSVGYMHLAQLYCSPQLAADRAGNLNRILTLADAVDPLGTPEHHAAAADYLRDAEMIDLAVEQAGYAVESLPKRGRPHFVRGGLHAMQERWSEALDDFRMAVALEPTKYASARFDNLGTEAALPLLLSELARDPADYVVQDAIYCFVQKTHGDDTRLSMALDALGELEARTDASAHARIANERGDLFYYVADYASAAQEFRRAWSLERVTVHGTNLVAALRKQRLWSEADAAIDEVFSATHDAAWRAEMQGTVAYEHANEFLGNREYALAADAYARAVEFAPEQGLYWFYLAIARTRLYRLGPSDDLAEKTKHAWSQLVRLDPTNADNVARSRDFDDLVWGVRRFGRETLSAPAALSPIRIYIGSHLESIVRGDEEGTLTAEASSRIQVGIKQWIREDYGVNLPFILFSPYEGFPPDGYALALFEVFARLGSVQPNSLLAFGTGAAELVAALNIDAVEAAHPLSGDPGYWIPDDHIQLADEHGVARLSPIDYILFDLASLILSRLPEFLGHEELDDLLIEKGLKTGQLTRLLQVLRGLLAERVPIVDFAAILNHVEAAPATLSVGDLLAQVRLLPSICAKLPGNTPRSVIHRFPDTEEQLLRAAVVDYAYEKIIALPVEDCRTVLETVQSIVTASPATVALVVEDGQVRPLLRRFISEEYPRLWVLSAREVVSAGEVDEGTYAATTVSA